MKGVSQHDISSGQRELEGGEEEAVNVIHVSFCDCPVHVRVFACLHVIEYLKLVSDGKRERESKKQQE